VQRWPKNTFSRDHQCNTAASYMCRNVPLPASDLAKPTETRSDFVGGKTLIACDKTLAGKSLLFHSGTDLPTCRDDQRIPLYTTMRSPDANTPVADQSGIRATQNQTSHGSTPEALWGALRAPATWWDNVIKNIAFSFVFDGL